MNELRLRFRPTPEHRFGILAERLRVRFLNCLRRRRPRAAGMASRFVVLSAIILATGTNGARACDRYAAPFFRGSGGFVVEPKDGRSAELTVQSDTESATRKLLAAGDGLAVELLTSPLCTGPNGVFPAQCRVTFRGIWGGGWYWVNGERNAAVAPLVCQDDLGGGAAPLDPGGVQTLPSRFGTGTLFVHDTQGLMGIVPQLSPTDPAGKPSCERYVAPFFRGQGGFVARPEAGQTAEAMIERGGSTERTPLSPRSDGLVVQLLSDSLCADANGRPMECKVSFTGIGAGGWYWVNGDRNAAVAPLVCEGNLTGTPALEPGGVAAGRAAYGTGTLFVHDTQRLMGIVPHLSGGTDDDRHVELRVSIFGGGTVDVIGDGQLSCLGTTGCGGYFPAAGSVTLRGVAPPGYAFDTWEGCDSLAGTDCVVALHSDRLVFVSFMSTQPVEASKRVVEFDENRLNDILQYDARSGLMVLAADARVDDIGIHSILVSSDLDPERYFLRRVTDLRQAAGSPAYLKTVQATLGDLVAEGSVAARASFGAETVSSYILPPGVVPASHPASDLTVRELPDGRRSFAVSTSEEPLGAVALPVLDRHEGRFRYPTEGRKKIPIELEFEFRDEEDVVEIKGAFYFSFDVTILGDWDATGGWRRPWERTLVEALAKATIDTTVTVDTFVVKPSAFDKYFQKDIDGLQITLGTLWIPTPVPVPVPLILSGSLYLQVGLTAGLEPNLRVDASLTAGAKYPKDGGGWQAIWTPNFESTVGFPERVNAGANLRAGVLASLHADIGYIGGPTLYVGPYLKATAKIYDPPKGRCRWDYDAEIGGEVRIGGEVEILGYEVAKMEPPLLIWAEPLYQVARNCPDEVPLVPVPPEDRSLRVTGRSTGSIALAWDPPMEGGGLSYEVWRQRDDTSTRFRRHAAPAGPRFTDRNVLPDTRYCYRVRTVVGAARSAWGGQRCASTLPLDLDPPTAPGGIAAETRSSGAIALSWSRSVDDRGLSHYVIVQSAGGAGVEDAFAIESTRGLGLVVTGLNAGTEYCFGVRAVDESGNASDVVDVACASTFSISQARWRFRIACRGQGYQVAGAVDLDEEFVSTISVVDDAEDYDGDSLTYALTGLYDDATRVFDGAIDWSFAGQAGTRRDTFKADLSLDDTGDIATQKSGSAAGCDAVIRFDRQDAVTTSTGNAGATRAEPHGRDGMATFRGF